MTNNYKDKQVFITGGTGSIGWGIVKKLLEYNTKEIVIYSNNENEQFECETEIGKDVPISFIIGDIRDKERLYVAMSGSDIVFHTAALKHVPVCERNPYEAVKTNVIGTQNVIDCAFAHSVEKVIGISTDKAAHASNVLGSTKFLSERMMQTAQMNHNNDKTKFCLVRFGNVLGSRGSVIPTFAKQSQNGGARYCNRSRHD